MARFSSSQGSTRPADLKPQDSLTVQGTTPKVTIGDAGAEDTMLVFDGNAVDFHVSLDDTADDLVIGTGQTAGTNTLISINGDGSETKFNQPKITLGDGTAEDTYLVFDGNAQDYRIGLDDGTDTLEIGAGSAHGTTAAIIIDSNGDITKLGTDTHTSGQFLKWDGSKVVWDAASGGGGSSAADDITTGDAAVSIATSAGNITIDAQGNNTDIIFKGTDDTADITMLTLDGSEAGAATFNSSATFGGPVTVKGTDGDATSNFAQLILAGDLHGDAGDAWSIEGGEFDMGGGNMVPKFSIGNDRASAGTYTITAPWTNGPTHLVEIMDPTGVGGTQGQVQLAANLNVSNNMTVYGHEGASAYVGIYADQGDDAVDKWMITANSGGTLGISNYIGDSWAECLNIAPHATPASGLITVTGLLKVGSNIIQASDGGNTITMDTSDNVTIGNNLKVGGNVIQASDGGSTITMDTSDNVTIGNNLTTTGDLAVNGGDISYGNAQDATLSVGATAHNTAGKPLTISAGPTTAGTTNNIAGGNLVLSAGQGKGSGAGGDIIFKTANAGGSGSSLNSLATALTISDDLSSTFSGNVTFGVDDTGVDVRIFSATASEGVLYDASEDELALLLTTKLKFHDVGGGEEIFASANGHLEINAGTTLDATAPTIDLNASTAVTVTTPLFTIDSSTSEKPAVVITNTNDDANGATLQFTKNGTSVADNDVIGNIIFVSEDDGDNSQVYAAIKSDIPDMTGGAEEGRLTLSVASHDGTIQPGLIIASGDAASEVDVTIGNGSGDVTVAGTFGAMRNMASGFSSIDAAGKASNGDIIYGVGSNIGSLTAGKIYYFKSDGSWEETDADAEGTATGLIGVATHSNHGAGVLVRGFIQLHTLDATQSVGGKVYLSETAGAGDATAPSGTGDIVRIIGYATNPSNTIIWFDPDQSWVEIA